LWLSLSGQLKCRQEATLILNRIYTPSATSRYPRRSLTVFGIIALIFSLLSISAMGFTAYRAYESYVEERLSNEARVLESVVRDVQRQYETKDLAKHTML